MYSKIMRLLIVDDEPGICSALKKNFEREGFIVETASTGLEGLEMANSNPYDLIVLDYNLPKLNGLEVCKTLRTRKITTPIIMLSVEASIDNKAGLLNAGADDYLTKPFSFKELLARVKAILRRPNEIMDSLVGVGDLVINLDNQTVKKGGKEIYLTSKEYLLFEYLVQNKGRVINRQDLLEHVWDVNADPFTYTIEVHISKLRKKLATKGKNSIIRTIPGRGYRIEE